jgi:hypothetical protein
MTRPWFSEAEYRRAVLASIPCALPKLSDAEFDDVTQALLKSGIVQREIRHGMPGFAVTMEGLAIAGIRMGH